MKIVELYKIFLENRKIITDSRLSEKKAIFFALKGDNFNGNEFAKSALANGCSYAVIDEIKYKKDDRFLLVDNVLKTLQELATYHRKLMNIPVIGITGTNGKTTTKELMNAVLSKKYITLATKGNYNNHIGVPLTILSITENTQIAIVEMGANHKGEIAELCEIAQPNYGIITNVGKAHLEGFENIDGVIETKKALYQFLELNNGVAFVNEKNSLLKELSSKIPQVTYGNSAFADINGRILSCDPLLEFEWNTADSANEKHHVKSNIVGEYNFENVLAAVCIGNFFQVSPDKINLAIKEYISNNNRSQIVKTKTNIIILDAYNANPTSMNVAINSFCTLKYSNKIAIIGDMLELGSSSEEEHKKIIDVLMQTHLLKIFLVGNSFSSFNLPPERFVSFANVEDAFVSMKQEAIHNATILIKGSRGIKLEKLVELF